MPWSAAPSATPVPASAQFGPKVRREIVLRIFSNSLRFSQNLARTLCNFSNISQNFARDFSRIENSMLRNYKQVLRNSAKFWEKFEKFRRILRNFEKCFSRASWVQDRTDRTLKLPQLQSFWFRTSARPHPPGARVETVLVCASAESVSAAAEIQK